MAKSHKLILFGAALILVAAVTGISLYRMAPKAPPVDVHMLIDKGITEFRNNQYEQSLQTLESIPEGLVEDWHVPYYMGSALIKLKQYEPGARQLEKALALNNSNENIFFALGVVYYKLGNLGLSKAYFGQVLKINPGNEEAKGLMDIMARLERNQADGVQEDKSENAVVDGK